MSRPQVQLLTRAGCTICERVHAQLKQLAAELDFELGDRLPVVLLDGREHSYWEVDEPRLRKDLKGPR
jgi:Glutaredoxin-like domain (DUF836)